MKNFMILLIAGLVTGFIACKKSGAPAPIPAAGSDRKITMTVDNPTPATGTNVSFTLVAKNNGPAASTGISVSDVLPSGYTLVSATATMGSYAA
ncbi:MAG TPA: DUF11 domain-containing protein, partial [Puia sp.]|nr:DUF11 domain-containing protein [Puia sp.]